MPWSEYVVAERLQALFAPGEDVSVYMPLSRQEKGVDLALVKKSSESAANVITVQVKASRTYLGEPPKRPTTQRYACYLWYPNFQPGSADYFVLVGFYPTDRSETRKVRDPRWYATIALLFSREEMIAFTDGCRTKKEGKRSRFFGFGFDEPSAIYQSLGDPLQRRQEYSERLLERSGARIRVALGLEHNRPPKLAQHVSDEAQNSVDEPNAEDLEDAA